MLEKTAWLHSDILILLTIVVGTRIVLFCSSEGAGVHPGPGYSGAECDTPPAAHEGRTEAQRQPIWHVGNDR